MANITHNASEGDSISQFTLGVIYRHGLYNTTISLPQSLLYFTFAAENKHVLSSIILCASTFTGVYTNMNHTICKTYLLPIYYTIMHEKRSMITDMLRIFDYPWPDSLVRNKELNYDNVKDLIAAQYDGYTYRSALLRFYKQQDPIPFDKIEELYKDTKEEEQDILGLIYMDVYHNYTKSSKIFTPSPLKNTTYFYMGEYFTYRYGLGVAADKSLALQCLYNASRAAPVSPYAFYLQGKEALIAHNYKQAYSNFSYIFHSNLPQPIYYKHFLDINKLGTPQDNSNQSQVTRVLLTSLLEYYRPIVESSIDSFEQSDYVSTMLYLLLSIDMEMPYSYSFVYTLLDKIHYQSSSLYPIIQSDDYLSEIYHFINDLSIYSNPTTLAKTRVGKNYFRGEYGYPQDYSRSYQLLSDSSDSEASLFLGYMYEYGLGVSQDLTSAKSMYDRSISQSKKSTNFVGYLMRLKLFAKCAYETYKVTGFSGLFDFINKLNIYKHEDIVLKNNCEIFNTYSEIYDSL